MGRRLLQAVTASEQGSTAIEYALIGAFVVMCVIVGVNVLSTSVGEMFAEIAAEFAR